nr:RNA-directed DNA polymerase, eukaryota [Tanacetum cinerariifolium]
MAARNRSYSDQTRLISKLIFVTNFSDNTTAKDLWEVCEGYGSVVDVFIPNRKSRSGKRFAFVRFIKVDDVDRLVENLCTLWIGRMHLHANVVRYDRPPISSSRPNVAPRSSAKPVPKFSGNGAPSFVSVLKGNPNTINHISTSPATVLDDECLVERDLDNFQVRIVYLGGLWVMIELPSIDTKRRFMKHVGVASWFNQIRMAQSDFASRERIVWLDIKGVPLHAWSRPTFFKIGSRWGEVLELEDNKDDCFAQKNDDMSKKVNMEDESDIEGVFETIFGDQVDTSGHELKQNSLRNEKETSSDPFNLYSLINKRVKGETTSGLDPDLRFPPGFTPVDHLNKREGGSLLEVIDDMIKVGQAMGFTMEGSLGSKAKNDWIKELNNKHKVNFLTIQETKSEHISDMDIKTLWGNSMFDSTISASVGNSGGILCVWDPSVFDKQHHIIFDNFIALYGSWVSKKAKLLMIAIYAPQSSVSKRMLWNYISSLIGSWDSQYMVMGDFNEVRCVEDRFGLDFNVLSANEFNSLISNSGLVEIQLEGYSFTWSLQSAKKISKLDRFFVSDGLLSVFPIYPEFSSIDISGIIALSYFGKWFLIMGLLLFGNKMVRFKKKLQILKKKIRIWVNDYHKKQSGYLEELRSNLREIDMVLNQGGVSDVILQRRFEILKNLHDINSANARDYMQKAKIQWAIEGDENSKFFHGIINSKRANLAIKAVMADGEWVDDPCRVKKEFRLYFSNRFRAPNDTSYFARGCNSSFIALIPKNQDPKSVNDYRPISLIGCLYKVVTKILANRLSSVISELISDVQTAFLPNRQILDGPFIINELLSWCKHKKQQAMVFKVDFAKAYDYVSFSLLSGLSINLIKSNLLGVGVCSEVVKAAAVNLRCLVMKTPFKYLGVLVGGNCATSQAWEDSIGKLKARLSNWKLKTLSVGGRLTLLKSALGSTPIYNLSIYKAPKSVLHSMESLGRNFFNGAQCNERKRTWIKWTTILASKKNGGLGVSSLYALNRALLFKWVWRFISRDNSLWCRLIMSIHGSRLSSSSSFRYSTWLSILREFQSLKDPGVDLMSHFRIQVDSSVAAKLLSITSSFRRPARGGAETLQLSLLQEFTEGTILSFLEDRWVWDLNGE